MPISFTLCLISLVSLLPRTLSLSTPSNPPTLATWDGNFLHHLRLSLTASSTHSPLLLSHSTALQHLHHQTAADIQHLHSSPYPTVTSKSSTPPNATFHHFVSLVPYAFPCNDLPEGCHGYRHAPIDLSTCDNSTGLPWQICDGKLNTLARDSMTDRPALENMMHYVMRLSIAAYVFADTQRAKVAAQIMDTWFIDDDTKMLPSLRFAQGIPGLYEGKASGCIDLSFFGRGFADAVQLLRQTPEASRYWTEKKHAVFGEWCATMAEHMVNDTNVNPERRMRNNHGLYYDLTVMSLLTLAGRDRSTSEVLRNMLSDDCEGYVFCVRGRFEDQIDEEGRQVHEMQRAGYGHYVYYTLLAHAHLFALTSSLGDVAVEGSAMVKAADWTLGDWKNLTADTSAAWLVYGSQMYRIVSRFTGDEKYEKAGCEILEKMRKARGVDGIWQGERVGMDVWNVALPSLGEQCGAWKEMPKLDLELLDMQGGDVDFSGIVQLWVVGTGAFLLAVTGMAVIKRARMGKGGFASFRYKRAKGREFV